MDGSEAKKETVAETVVETEQEFEAPSDWKRITVASKPKPTHQHRHHRHRPHTSAYDDDYDNARTPPSQFNPLWNVPRLGPGRSSVKSYNIPPEIVALKKYRVPVHYLVTTYVHIMAKDLNEAMEKAMIIEPPHLDLYDATAHDTTIEPEIDYGHTEELDEE
jgi:hypothetical protein